MNSETKQWMGGLLIGVVLTSLIAIGIAKVRPVQQSIPEPIANLLPKDVIDSYNRGLKDALRLNPVSWELEQACLTLWANKQPMEDLK